MKKKNCKKNKKKFSLKKLFKGFTLVELLAVIVILAIIMIIAIPAVLNTMKTAKQEGFVEYATKIMNKTEEVYMQNQLSGVSYARPTEVTYIFFDISKDLGFTSTGSYNGFGFIRLYNDEIHKGVYLYDDEYMVMYSTTEYSEQLSKKYISTISTYNDYLKPLGKKFSDVDFYDLMVYILSYRRCTEYNDSIVNGSTGLQEGCSNLSHSSTYYGFDENNNWICKEKSYDESTLITDAFVFASKPKDEQIYTC